MVTSRCGFFLRLVGWLVGGFMVSRDPVTDNNFVWLLVDWVVVGYVVD